jgi:hypothetical protein
MNTMNDMHEPISDSLNRINLITDSRNKGFTMTFANRITVSVRWGLSCFSDGKTTAECMAWSADDHRVVRVMGMQYLEDEDIIRECTTDEVAAFMYNASLMTLGVNG